MKLINKIKVSLTEQFIIWLIPILILIVWQIVVQSGLVSSRVMPAPLDVIIAGFTLTANGELIHHFLVSLQRALLGLIIGGALGFYFTKRSFEKQLKDNPPINEKMIRAMYMQMGRKPSEAQIKQIMKSMDQYK